jgi:hypothetical protein
MRALLSTAESFLRGLSNFFWSEIWERRKCRACRAAARFEPARERAVRIHAAINERFGCERFTLGPHCPGRVLDAEYLNLIITDPQTIDHRTGRLLPVLVKQVDEKGLSVLRDQAANDEFEITYAQLKEASDSAGKERFFHGVCRFQTSVVRYENNERYLGVYATALPGRRYHADIFAPPLTTRREHEARKKNIIYKIGPSLVGVSDFRNRAFSGHARPVGSG